MDRPRILILITAGLILSGCGGVRFSSNLGEYGQARIQSSVVDIYQQSEVFEHNYVALGMVDTAYCGDERDIHEGRPAPTVSAMKDTLRLQTRKLGGNALVIKECGSKTYAGCTVYRECVGLAYEIKES
ncbi:hypothetical protein L2725_12465 [Shewanella corallii]|uniref:Lipoprotein n=1 Tax=Shewanella corallii TaxID=560080 RepID=A0ABT0N9Q2_9GAMM|nr:hypothetical protein [Shewanella corallii]MCL2914581.1 hypothetical protein [Shewanella corallii]